LSDTTAIPRLNEIEIGSNAYQIRVDTQSVALAGIGDTHTLQLNFLEQVDAVTMAAAVASQTNPAKIATFDFRWSTDASTWSSWDTFTTINVAALTPTANNRFYLEVRLTRSGASPAGVIVWDSCYFNITRNPNAFAGWGSMADRTLQGDLYSLFAKMIEAYMPLSASGAKRWETVQTFPNKQSSKGGLIPVYIYGLRKSNSYDMHVGGTYSQDPWELRICVKTLGENKGSDIQGVTAFDFICQTIRFLFDSRTAETNLYTFTYKGVQFNGVAPSAFNVYGLECQDRGESAGDNDVYHEFSLKFTVPQNKIIYGYASV